MRCVTWLAGAVTAARRHAAPLARTLRHGGRRVIMPVAMLLTFTTAHRPTPDLGYLFHKNPAKLQTFELSFGKAHVLPSEAMSERWTAALLLAADSLGLVREHARPAGEGFVHDLTNRPYAALSFLGVTHACSFGSAFVGRSGRRQELADSWMPLTAADDKHYWVAETEVENLARRGDRGLATHPQRDVAVQE